MRHKLKIPSKNLFEYRDHYLERYEGNLADISDKARSQGYLTLSQLHRICQWKSSRRPDLAKKNTPAFVKEITRFAFSAECEAARIGALTLLEGVQYPTASVILHFCMDDTYPILDFRALWSLSIKKPASYTSKFWIDYIKVCRHVATAHGMTVRELDMALWKYSEMHQKE